MENKQDKLMKLDEEKADIVYQISMIDSKLSLFDSRLSSEQALIRSEGLPDNESYSKWIKRKNVLLNERGKLIEDKLILQHRLTRIKLKYTETRNEGSYHKYPKCLECGHTLIEDDNGIHCDNGHEHIIKIVSNK
jgi:hypothetical protein